VTPAAPLQRRSNKLDWTQQLGNAVLVGIIPRGSIARGLSGKWKFPEAQPTS
jgi:hypothetical protein